MKKVSLLILIINFIFLVGCNEEYITQPEDSIQPVIKEELIEKKFLNAPIFIDLTSQTQIYLPPSINGYEIKWTYDNEIFKFDNHLLSILKDGKTTLSATIKDQKYTYTETFSFTIKNQIIIQSEQHGLVFYYDFLNSSNKKVGKKMIPQMIVFHNTANSASAYNEIRYLHSMSNTSTTSYHYAVDDTGIYQAIPNTNYAYHAGNMSINQVSIGIEIAKSTINNNDIKDKATKNAIKLISLLMYNYALDVDKVITHQAASGKYCPHDILNRYGLNRFYEELNQENVLYKDYVAFL